MLTTRCLWGATTVLLCALLSQNCQSQLNALEEESPAAAPPQSGWQPPASEALTQPLGYPLSPLSTTTTHKPKVPPAAFAGISPSAGLHTAASTTRARNIFTQDPHRPFTASTGELVRFQQVGSQWQAVVQGKNSSHTPQRTLSVVSSCDISKQLASWQRQDIWSSRSRIHIMATSYPPYTPCVYLGKSGLLGGGTAQQAPLAVVVARADAARDKALARANAERDKAVARANAERDKAVARVNVARDEAVARANAARDKAVARADLARYKAVARANTARYKAVARANTARYETVARANEAESTARDQEIAQTSNALAAALTPLGEAEWKQYFGDVGSAPDLPSDMAAVLDGPCPFWSNKKVRDTHLLVLIPATVGGVPFTLNRLGELITHPNNGGHKTKYSYYNKHVKAQIGEQSPPRSYWLLMTRDVLPESQNKSYAAQKELVAGYASGGSVPYELPSVLEVATAILMHHAREGERLFGSHPLTHTRCQEVVDVGCPAVVGYFKASGLHVSPYDFVSSYSGVTCCRKF